MIFLFSFKSINFLSASVHRRSISNSVKNATGGNFPFSNIDESKVPTDFGKRLKVEFSTSPYNIASSQTCAFKNAFLF